jgi:Myb/SANT-like DNA-binding domain
VSVADDSAMDNENHVKLDKKQRSKKKNFTVSEVEIIKDEVKKNFNIITAKHCSGSTGVTKKMQDCVWNKITTHVNALGVCERSVFEIKEKWNNMKKKAKEAYTVQKLSSKKTGGGPPISVMDPITEDVAELYQQSASFTGIPGASDCESQIILTGKSNFSVLSELFYERQLLVYMALW